MTRQTTGQIRDGAQYPPPLTCGQRIRDQRHELSLSIGVLAAKSGVPELVIFETERGGQDLRVADLLAIAGALDLDPSALIASTGGTAAGFGDNPKNRHHSDDVDALLAAFGSLSNRMVRQAVVEFVEALAPAVEASPLFPDDLGTVDSLSR